MSAVMTGNDRKVLQETNVGLQLIVDTTQAQSSAMVLLQWCMAKPFIDYLVENNIRKAYLLLSVRNPAGVETRYLYDLSSEQEIVQFRTPGEHTLNAVIVWNANARILKDRLLYKEGGRYWYDIDHLLGMNTEKHSSRIKMKRMGSAEAVLTVPSAFFAPQLSSTENWWINLMFPSSAQNSCSIRRRRMFAYTLQPLVLLVWVSIKALWRFAIAFVMGVLLGLRCDWRAIVQPFEKGYEDVWARNPNNTSWLMRRSDKKMREWADFWLLCTPMVQIVVSLIAISVAAGAKNELTLLSFVLSYVAVVVAIVAFFSAIYFGGKVSDNYRQWFTSLWARLRPTRLEHLACTTAPVHGLRPTRYRPRFFIQYVKSLYCRPLAS